MTTVLRPAKHFTHANRTRDEIRGVCIHTAECGERLSAAEDLASWTAGASASRASWHYAVDADSITQSVEERDVAWHAGPANSWSIGVEHAGYASQDAGGWADDFSLRTLERSAELVGGICRRYGIPVRKLSAADLAAGERAGIFGHVDVTRGLTGGKGHTDPGAHFPWDFYLARVSHHAGEPDHEPAFVEAVPTKAWPTGNFNEQLVEIECDGERWLVLPVYLAPVGIGQAAGLVSLLRCELPTPRLVDAIWRAADLRIDGSRMVRSDHDGTPRTMDSPAMHASQVVRLEQLIGDRSLGRDFRLLAGAFKDVVQLGGKVGLYGWHRADGRPIQPPFAGHAPTWRDYSQGVRPVRRAGYRRTAG